MQREMDDSVDGDLEEMLKRELADMSVEKRSARFRMPATPRINFSAKPGQSRFMSP